MNLANYNTKSTTYDMMSMTSSRRRLEMDQQLQDNINKYEQAVQLYTELGDTEMVKSTEARLEIARSQINGTPHPSHSLCLLLC